MTSFWNRWTFARQLTSSPAVENLCYIGRMQCRPATSKSSSPDMNSLFRLVGKAMILFLLLVAGLHLQAREKDAVQYGMGLITNVPFPATEVNQVVSEIVQNGIIRGTKEYNKDEYVSGAVSASSTRVFPQWTEGGQVYYKIREHALDPRNFKDSGDVGTLAVRYVVQPQGDKNSVLRIDAIFVEDFRHTSHASNGSVETAEYKDIHDRLEWISTMKAQAVEAEREKKELLEHKSGSRDAGVSSSSSSQPMVVIADAAETNAAAKSTESTENASQTLEEKVKDLRRQVERKVKAPGAPLKSAPFHTASTLQLLGTGTEVLVVIQTPYWLGIETHDGQHGWMPADALEQAP